LHVIIHYSRTTNLLNNLQVRQVLEAHPEGSVKLHEKKTVVVMEGPAFSTRAESLMYRQIGVSIYSQVEVPMLGANRVLRVTGRHHQHVYYSRGQAR
jgi:purine nucleoside phosphorylase